MTSARLASPRPSRLWLVSILLLVAAQALLWFPMVAPYRVAIARPSAAIVQADRIAPSSQMLALIADASMMTDHPLSGAAAVEAADHLLRGELALPSLPVLKIASDFSPADLQQGVPVQQLWLASLIVPDLLLRAYEYSHRREYLVAAQRYVQHFASWESRRWLPTGWLWNAHAVSNRVAVLARLWRQVRDSQPRDPEFETLIHEQAARLGAMLSKPELFTAGTNHGVMQNVALLQLALAFPAMPDADLWMRTSMDRLQQQLPFYVSSEGPVLEHSAGYHFHGVVVTGFVVKLLEAAGRELPPAILSAHQRALQYLQDMQRPDRTLPSLGDTYRYAWHLPAILGIDQASWDAALQSRGDFTRLLPIAGSAIWWSAARDGSAATHTTIPWGYFASNGHRRAQEMSVLIWADGTDWSTNTGYWPGEDAPGTATTNGWDGGNAPHLLGETADGPRSTRLVSSLQNAELRLLDLERQAPGGALRRQVLQFGSSTWLVLDSADTASASTLRVLWTAAPETQLQSLGGHRYFFRNPGRPLGLAVSVQGAAGMSDIPLRGSRQPFGGWVAHDRRAYPAPSVDLRLRGRTHWMASELELRGNEFGAAERVSVSRFTGPEDWELRVRTPQGDRLLSRSGQKLRWLGGDGGDAGGQAAVDYLLEPGPDVTAGQARIAAAARQIRERYPPLQLHEWERQRAFLLLLLSWPIMVLLTWLISLKWRHAYRALWVAAQGAWTAGAGWLLFVYMRS